jgi:hypothetical protein
MRSFAFVLFAALIFSGGASAQSTWHAFGQGKAEVLLPSGFSPTIDAEGTLRARFGQRETHILEISLQDHEGDPGSSDVAERFVQAYAEKKKLKATRGANRVIVMEPAGDFTDGGKVFRRVHWQVGFGKSLVIITLTAPLPMSSELNEFLGRPLNEMVSSLRRRNA